MDRFRSLTKSTGIWLAVAFVAIAAGGFGIAYNLSNKNTAIAAAAECAGTCVYLREGKADPATVAVPAGSFVQFNSADGTTHNMSQGKGGAAHEHNGSFSSGPFKADEAWRVQFKKEGTYHFHDHYNPNINVMVVVYTPGKDYKIQ